MAFVEELPDWGESWLAGDGIAPGTFVICSFRLEDNSLVERGRWW